MKRFLKIASASMLVFVAILTIRENFARAQTYTGPSATPPGNNPAGPVWLQTATPQSGGFNISGQGSAGELSITNVGGGQNLYMVNGHAIRVDADNAMSTLNVGNWGTGSTGINLNVQGNVTANGVNNNGQGTISAYRICINNTDCRTSWPLDQTTADGRYVKRVGPDSMTSAGGVNSVTFTVSNPNGTGITASGTGAVGVGVVATGTYHGLEGNGNNTGVVGHGRVGIEGQGRYGVSGIGGDTGVTGVGVLQGGQFNSGSNIAVLGDGVQDYGGWFMGDSMGAYASGVNIGLFAKSNNTGISGEGYTLGGEFWDMNDNSYAYLGWGKTGVYGNGDDVGVYGQSYDKVGVIGNGNLVGVQGNGASAGGEFTGGTDPSRTLSYLAYGNYYGVYASGTLGVYGEGDVGVHGHNYSNGFGVDGYSARNVGVRGISGNNGTGVYGYGMGNSGVGGSFRGNYGVTALGTYYGVVATSTLPAGTGVRGYGRSGGGYFSNINNPQNYGNIGDGTYGAFFHGDPWAAVFADSPGVGIVSQGGTVGLSGYSNGGTGVQGIGQYGGLFVGVDSGGFSVSDARVATMDGDSFYAMKGNIVSNDNEVRIGSNIVDGANLRLLSSGALQWNLDNYGGAFRVFSETSPGVGGVERERIQAHGSTNATILTSLTDINHFISLYSGSGADPDPAYVWQNGRDMRFGMWADLTNNASWTENVRFTAGGDALKRSGTTSWSIMSDIRLKDVKGSFDRGLDAITKLDPILFHYKASTPEGAFDPKPEYVGLSAQELQKVIPEAVSVDSKGYLQMHSDPIIYTMVNAIKELKSENDSLRAKLDDLTKRVDAMEKK